MTQAAVAEPMELEVGDMTGRRFRSSDVSADSTIGEALKRFLPRLGLSLQDRDGNPQTFRIRRDRDGQNLFSSDRVGDALAPGESVTVERFIQAGGSQGDERADGRGGRHEVTERFVQAG